VYENKGQNDNLPDTKDDISAWLNAILHRNTRIFWEPPAFLPRFARCGTNFSRQNGETRGGGDFAPPRGGINPPLPLQIGALPNCGRNWLLMRIAR
jgi:hypothetical protein